MGVIGIIVIAVFLGGMAIDESLLFLQAVSQLEAPHIRVGRDDLSESRDRAAGRLQRNRSNRYGGRLRP
jgi:hypothetical protein